MVAGRRTIVVTTVAGARPPLQPPIIPGFDDGHPVSAALLTDPPRASRPATGSSRRPTTPLRRQRAAHRSADRLPGALCLSQMAYVGRQGTSLQTEWPGRGPSAMTCEVFHQVPHVMRNHEIEQIVRQCAVCARRLKDGGFDGCDLAFYCDSFANQFWNPKSSVRTDEYGGSLENRMRVSLEILEAVRTRPRVHRRDPAQRQGPRSRQPPPRDAQGDRGLARRYSAARLPHDHRGDDHQLSGARDQHSLCLPRQGRVWRARGGGRDHDERGDYG